MLLLLGLVAVSVSARSQQYTVTEIPVPAVPLGIATAPPIGHALNASGEVAGQFAAQPFYNGVPDGASHLFVYANGMTTDLGADNPFYWCGSNGGPVGLGINAQGDIAGNLCINSAAPIAFVMLKSASGYGSFVPFNSVIQTSFPALVGATGDAINGNGLVAGTMLLPNTAGQCDGNLYHPFVYDSSTGVVQDLIGVIQQIHPNGGCSAQALAISDLGQVAGYFTDAGGIYHAYVYSSSTGTAIDLGNLGGIGTFAQAMAISSNGQMVTGYSQAAGSNPEAFLYTGGAMQAVGDLGSVHYSVGNGVNASGEVTGRSLTGPNAASHAFVFSNSAGIQDLNSLISATDAANYTLANGVAINDTGQVLVLATETATSQQVTLLLTPVASVPNVVGDTQAAATSALTAAGFVLGTATTQASTTVAPGIIISQDPGAGTSAEPGSAVNLVVSSGVTVPNLVGLPLSEALDPSLVLAITQQYSGTVPQGIVIAQSPAAGSSVAGGTLLNLVVSEGPAPLLAQVPNVIGDTQAAATAALTGAELTLGTVGHLASGTVDLGKVLSQNPVAGDSVAVGSAVNVVLSIGPPQISIGLAGPPRFTYNGSVWVVAIGIKNNGNVTADVVQATLVSLNGALSPDGGVEAVNLAPGAAQYVEVNFPVTVTSGILRLAGPYSAGTLTGNWNISARVSVPAVP